MYIRKDGRLCERVRLPNGKIRDIYALTEKEMKQKLVAFNIDLEHGRLFSAVIDEWWEFHKSEIEYNTISSYIRPIKDVKEALGNHRVGEITPLDIQRYLTTYAHAGGAKRARQTVKLRRTVINQALNFAILQTQEIKVNPAVTVKIPKGCPSQTREPLTEEEMAIVKASAGKPFGLFPFLLAYTGMRPGEALALKYEDIDRTKGVIHITKSLLFAARGKSEIKAPKTAKGVRDAILLKPLADRLPKSKKGFIFSPDPARAITGKEYRGQWAKYREETGTSFDPYQCRHYYASLLYESGVGVKDAQELMGHAKASTTLNIYTHIRINKTEALAQQIEAHIL